MNSKLSLSLRWVSGKSLLVKVNDLDPVRAVFDLCKDDVAPHAPPRFIHNGRVLNPQLSFKFQNVRNGDSIVVYEPQHEQRIVFDLDSCFEDNVLSIMNEVMRLNDRSFQFIEVNRGTARLYDQLHQEDENANEMVLDAPIPTVITTSSGISSQPLPNLEKADEDEDDDLAGSFLVFETVEEAGKYFSKHPLSEWIW